MCLPIIIFLFLNGPTPASLIVYFRSFQTNIITILQQLYVKNVHLGYSARIRTHNLQQEPPPITTRPGLPPQKDAFYTFHYMLVPWYILKTISKSQQVTCAMVLFFVYR